MKPILFNVPYQTKNEIRYLKDSIKRNHFIGNGYYTKKCQYLIQKKLNLSKVLLTDSCTSALEMSALLIKKKGIRQEIILPSYTFPTTASAFLRAGFKLVFADIDPKDFMIDIEDVKKKINKYTAGIIIVHYGSFCADLNKFKKICNDNSIYLIEDAAQGFNSFLNKKSIGSFGDLSTFSFHTTKNIHAGLSGALVVNNKKFIKKADYIWERGTDRKKVIEGKAKKYSWVEIGGSFYPTELQAAFLYAQLKKLEENKSYRKKIYYTYYRNLINLKKSNLIYFPEITSNYDSNFHSFWILLKNKTKTRQMINFLKKQKIYAYIGYIPLHTSKIGREYGYDKYKLKNTEKYSYNIIRLPFHNYLKKSEIIKICKLIQKKLKN
tara:strand:- start:1280 stop:2419 length:1140 start_codon:yes stop_codon:yes gene_type:complete